jgi:hypothetical protein
MGVRDRIPRMKAHALDLADDRARQERARAVVSRWNAGLAGGGELPLWSPNIGAALLAGTTWLEVLCPACVTIGAVDLRRVDRHPEAAVASLVLGLTCSRCGPAPRCRGCSACRQCHRTDEGRRSGRGTSRVWRRVRTGRAISSCRWSRARSLSITPPRPASGSPSQQINRRTGNRLKQQLVDAVTGEPVGSDDKARGYEVERDSFLLIEDDELDAIQVESTRTVEIDAFVPADQIDPRLP